MPLRLEGGEEAEELGRVVVVVGREGEFELLLRLPVSYRPEVSTAFDRLKGESTTFSGLKGESFGAVRGCGKAGIETGGTGSA